jgi:division protein CdvB (Snf7/Vps24/ESCRT-III family)
MDINDKYLEVIESITKKMMSYDKQDFLNRLDKKEDGKFSKIVREYGLDLTLNTEEYSDHTDYSLPDSTNVSLIDAELTYSNGIALAHIENAHSPEGEVEWTPRTALAA